MDEETCIENCFACEKPVATFHKNGIENSMVIPFCKECLKEIAKKEAKK